MTDGKKLHSYFVWLSDMTKYRIYISHIYPRKKLQYAEHDTDCSLCVCECVCASERVCDCVES